MAEEEQEQSQKTKAYKTARASSQSKNDDNTLVKWSKQSWESLFFWVQ